MSKRPSSESFCTGGPAVIWVLWLTYGSFYFCRNNLALALPGMQSELGYTKAELGTILMSLKLAYGAGQFINGQLAERFSPRILLAIGMLASAALNVLFGLATAFYFLLFIWACNGYVQALGWPPTVRVAANWFPPHHRGRAMGIIGTGYQLGGALTFVIAGWAAYKFGWRGALYVPAVLLVLTAVHMLVFLRPKPEAQSASVPRELRGDADDGSPRATFAQNIAITLRNPALWLIALTLCLVDACRYGFTDWGVTHLNEVHGTSVKTAAFKYAVLPFGGMAGAYVSGWATDRLFAGRRAPVICILLILLGLLAISYHYVIRHGMLLSIVVLFLIGFCIFGAQVLLVGTFPMDMARRGTAAAAVGFVNFMGYMGAAAGDKLTGHLAEDYGWKVAVFFWAGCALVGAMIIACLWKVKAREETAPAIQTAPTEAIAAKS